MGRAVKVPDVRALGSLGRVLFISVLLPIECNLQW